MSTEQPRKMAELMEARRDGPHSSELTIDTARTVEDGLQALVHMTGYHSATALEGAPDLYDVLGALTMAATYLDKTLANSATWLREQHGAGNVAAVFGRYDGDTDSAIHAATAALSRARGGVSALVEGLNAAHSATSGLVGRDGA